MKGFNKAKLSRKIKMGLPLMMLLVSGLACDLERSMGVLTLEPQTFEVTEGWEYDWNVEVTSGEEYEVILTTVNTNTTTYAIIDVVSGLACEGCISSVEGNVTPNGLIVTFSGSESGRSTIRVYVREGTATYIIQIRETP